MRAYAECVPRLSVRKRKLPLQRRQRESERLYMHRAVPVVRRMVFGTLAQSTKKRTIPAKRNRKGIEREEPISFGSFSIYRNIQNINEFRNIS